MMQADAQIAYSEIAQQFGTPCYVYSPNIIRANFRELQHGLSERDHLICYAVKANSNLSILRCLKECGAGFDIVSGGELARCLKIGADPQTIVFSGVGKLDDELAYALDVGILSFNIESGAELERLIRLIKQRGMGAIQIALRVNPDVDAKTHPYISTGLKNHKFGIAPEDLPQCLSLIDSAAAYVQLTGLACHIGSQLTSTEPYQAASEKMIALWQQLHKHYPIKRMSMGGGFGIRYQNEQPPSLCHFGSTLCQYFAQIPVQLIVEPGRSLLGPAGVLLTKVIDIKEGAAKQFVVVDAAMNDLLRPALYDAWHEIENVSITTADSANQNLVDVVGPVCETSDFLGKDRQLSAKAGDLLIVKNVGAYGFSMSSQYNSRPRPPEIFVENGKVEVIRRRERLEDLWAAEW